MALPHAQSGEVIDLRPLGSSLADMKTTTLIKTEHLEVIRLILPAGKEISTHQVAGEITVHCLEGRVAFQAGGATRNLEANQLLYLSGNVPHSIAGIDDAAVLLTILLK